MWRRGEPECFHFYDVKALGLSVGCREIPGLISTIADISRHRCRPLFATRARVVRRLHKRCVVARMGDDVLKEIRHEPIVPEEFVREPHHASTIASQFPRTESRNPPIPLKTIMSSRAACYATPLAATHRFWNCARASGRSFHVELCVGKARRCSPIANVSSGRGWQ